MSSKLTSTQLGPNSSHKQLHKHGGQTFNKGPKTTELTEKGWSFNKWDWKNWKSTARNMNFNLSLTPILAEVVRAQSLQLLNFKEKTTEIFVT